MSIQLEPVDDPIQERMNEKINIELVKISEAFKAVLDKLEDIETRLEALENP